MFTVTNRPAHLNRWRDETKPDTVVKDLLCQTMSLGLIRTRVLVVDDERVIADTLVQILRKKGHDAYALYDAESAIALAAELDPDALISDVVMAGMNGIELTTYFAHHFPECKVLLMSGNAATTGLLEDARRHGHDLQFLPKPLNPDDVLEFLAACVMRYEQR